MASKSTVAVDVDLRKKIKKLSALLDLSQGELIRQAVAEFEQKLLKRNGPPEKKDLNETERINLAFKEATMEVWAKDTKTKKIQQKLMEGPETIDDFILNEWDPGIGS